MRPKVIGRSDIMFFAYGGVHIEHNIPNHLSELRSSR